MAEAKHMRINKPLHNAFHPNMYKWVNKKFIIADLILKIKARNSYRNENVYPKRPVAELRIEAARKYTSPVPFSLFCSKRFRSSLEINMKYFLFPHSC